MVNLGWISNLGNISNKEFKNWISDKDFVFQFVWLSKAKTGFNFEEKKLFNLCSSKHYQSVSHTADILASWE